MSPTEVFWVGTMFAVLSCIYTLIELRRRGRPWYRNQESQSWIDGWTITHVGHGIVLFGIAKSAFPHTGYESLGFVIAAEALWESLENRDWVINLFRSAGDKKYFGDSVVNSMSDVVACTIGALFTGLFI